MGRLWIILGFSRKIIPECERNANALRQQCYKDNKMITMDKDKALTGYDLSRNLFDWCFENPEKVKPTHIALYFFIVEHCNRLGWKEKFGLPTLMAMEAIGIKNWRTYSKAFEDLVKWGFIEVHERSKNQWSATIIAIVKNTKANTKAYTKAQQKHIQKQSRSMGNSTVVIDKPINLRTKEPNNNGILDFEVFWDAYHRITGKAKTDKEAAEKYWGRLTKSEQAKAIESINPYFKSLKNKEYCHKARSYLSGKNFNDEFKSQSDNLKEKLLDYSKYSPV